MTMFYRIYYLQYFLLFNLYKLRVMIRNKIQYFIYNLNIVFLYLFLFYPRIIISDMKLNNKQGEILDFKISLNLFY